MEHKQQRHTNEEERKKKKTNAPVTIDQCCHLRKASKAYSTAMAIIGTIAILWNIYYGYERFIRMTFKTFTSHSTHLKCF